MEVTLAELDQLSHPDNQDQGEGSVEHNNLARCPAHVIEERYCGAVLGHKRRVDVDHGTYETPVDHFTYHCLVDLVSAAGFLVSVFEPHQQYTMDGVVVARACLERL